jgi:c-di-GMP-binding flagellar brake protein YcgR
MERPEPADKWPIKRKYLRFQIDLRLVVKTATVLYGRTKNINEGGMAATIAGDMNLEEIVQLQFQLPETRGPITIHAEVRYHQGSQYGFKFINITDQQSEAIRRAVRKLPVDNTLVGS